MCGCRPTQILASRDLEIKISMFLDVSGIPGSCLLAGEIATIRFCTPPLHFQLIWSSSSLICSYEAERLSQNVKAEGIESFFSLTFLPFSRYSETNREIKHFNLRWTQFAIFRLS